MPFLLIYMNNTFGLTLITVFWSQTATGIIFNIFFMGKGGVVSTLASITMEFIKKVVNVPFININPKYQKLNELEVVIL